MSEDTGSEAEAARSERAEIHNKDFQFVLKHLLAAYQPVLEEDLKRAKAPEELKKEAESKPASCEDEIALANRIFGKFVTEEVAMRLLPEEGRKQLGPIENWRWCFLHIRCCIIFGWLLCHRQRTFRAFAYYLYRYWLCVRQVLGTPVSHPPTAEEREDFQVLVRALATAYKPYLTNQLASVEFPVGIPDEVLDGKIDCLEGEEEAAAIFERLLTAETAPALLGRKAFEVHSKESHFWFCRCWCLCAIRFGCCLARARNFIDVLRCLLYYWRCLRGCFQPIRCNLTAPTGCAEEKEGLISGGVALQIEGTAAGAFFDHYTLEWRKVQGQACCPCSDTTGWSSLGISYPGGGLVGSAPVVSGTLGWLDTTTLPPDSYEIRLCVYSTIANTAACCFCIQFALFKKMVWIDRVADLPGAPVQTPPGWFDQPLPPQVPIVNTNPGGIIVPVGACISVVGTAVVGDCQNRKIACVDLRAAIGWQPGTAEPGFAASLPLYTIAMLLAPICYPDPDPAVEAKKRAPWNQLYERPLTARWVPTNIPPFDTQYCLPRYCFNSAGLLPPCPDTQHGCHSGKYTLLLDVTDTLNNHYYDTQQVWFDNKPIYVEFSGLEGVGACQDVCLRKYVPQGAPCNTCWPLNLLGIVFDEFIDPADISYPSDNFDFYSLSITRQGGPGYAVPITSALCPPVFGPDPLKGTQRVGEPGTRCEVGLGCPPPAFGAKFAGALTKLDLRIFDAVCAADPSLVAPFVPPAGFPLDRGQCCTYTFQLYAQDKTWSDGWAGGLHHAWSLPWAVEICNDLDSRERIPQCP
jgi:hypothetical protein